MDTLGKYNVMNRTVMKTLLLREITKPKKNTISSIDALGKYDVMNSTVVIDDIVTQR